MLQPAPHHVSGTCVLCVLTFKAQQHCLNYRFLVASTVGTCLGDHGKNGEVSNNKSKEQLSIYLAALAGFGNFRTEVRPEMLTTFPPQLSDSFFSLFLTCVTSFPIGRFRTRSSDDNPPSSGVWRINQKD